MDGARGPRFHVAPAGDGVAGGGGSCDFAQDDTQVRGAATPQRGRSVWGKRRARHPAQSA